ncbi:MAG: hypothetical protein LBF75_06045 [Treponema sp.]|jgi:uncharacterized glyoxalase superfamily protein PhnB|nr:hypothetical protein [Treponema sp.]
MNEVVFTIFESRFHMLDESSENGLNAPKEAYPVTIWFNILVEAVQPVFDKAMKRGFSTVFPITYEPVHNIERFMVKDPFGMVWLVHGY